MALTYGFFNSVDGDRKYTAEQISNYYRGILTDGVLENYNGKFHVASSGTGMDITVNTGRAYLDGFWVENDELQTLTVNASDVIYNRLDVVVLKLDKTTRDITLYIKKGSNGSVNISENPPERSQTVYEIYLASILVDAKTTYIAPQKITDLRGDISKCGFVTGLIKQVDTTELLSQYQTACEQLYNSMATELQTYFDTKKKQFDDFMSSLTEDLTVSTYLAKYQKSILTTETTNSLQIGIPEYAEGDILLVHVGGVLFVEDSEYTIDGTGETATITFKNPIYEGNTITFIVIKSEIGTLPVNEIDEILATVVDGGV